MFAGTGGTTPPPGSTRAVPPESGRHGVLGNAASSGPPGGGPDGGDLPPGHCGGPARAEGASCCALGRHGVGGRHRCGCSWDQRVQEWSAPSGGLLGGGVPLRSALQLSHAGAPRQARKHLNSPNQSPGGVAAARGQGDGSATSASSFQGPFLSSQARSERRVQSRNPAKPSALTLNPAQCSFTRRTVRNHSSSNSRL